MSARDTIDFTDAHRSVFFCFLFCSTLIWFPAASIHIDNCNGQTEIKKKEFTKARK